MTIRVTTIGKYKRPDDTVPIYLSFAGHGKTAFHGLGVYVLPSEFDKETGTVRTVDRRRKADFVRYNLLIQAELTRARNLLLSLQLAGKAGSILPARFKAMFAAGETDSEGGTFTDYFKSFIEKKTGRTREIYQNTLDKIIRLHGDDVPFDAVNHSWLENFDRSMRTSDICNGRGEVLRTGLATNARAIHLRNIRAVFNKAIDEEVIGLELYPFRRFKIEKERTRKRAVSLTQLRALFDYPCETVAEEWAVDVARLIFYLIGINTVDLIAIAAGTSRSMTANISTTGAPKRGRSTASKWSQRRPRCSRSTAGGSTCSTSESVSSTWSHSRLRSTRR